MAANSSSLHLHGLNIIAILSSLLIGAALVIPTTEASSAGVEQGFGWMPPMKSSQGCRGSVAECMGHGGDDEFDMDTEINRRILATTNYISYGALQRNSVPCSRRGASYYNCKPGAEANPYSRGCSTITRCRN